MGNAVDGQLLESLVTRIQALGRDSVRVMVGLTGPPGAGKSTLAAALAQALADDGGVVIPMDGFHIAARALATPEIRARRGAPDTFDADGFVHLLDRLRRRRESVVYAPCFERDIEDPIGSAIPVPRDSRYLIVEGNYLLDRSWVWRSARSLLDEVWFIDVDQELRRSRLIARHIEFGKSPSEAQRWTDGSDEMNATMIRSLRSEADLVVQLHPAGSIEA